MHTTQQTQSVMDTIITQHTNNAIFQKFGKSDHRVFIVSIPELKRTSLYVNLNKVGNSIENITWAQLEELQQKAFEMWLKLQN